MSKKISKKDQNAVGLDEKSLKKIGHKNEVFKGQATRTSGGLQKEDLMKNKHGRIVSVKKHELGKKNIDRLKSFQKGSESKKEQEDSDSNHKEEIPAAEAPASPPEQAEAKVES